MITLYYQGVSAMAKQMLEIHSENILPIIKKWLYSDKDIFVRELVSNSCDAIQKVRLLRDRGDLEVVDDTLRIDIRIDKANKTLTFSDNGIGMTAEEVRKYIAQIAFSGAEDFLAKYKSNDERDQFIGHFGLGFYSAYMVASKVQIDTLSYQSNAEPVLWTCDGSAEYELEVGQRTTRGTDITLFVDAESEEYLDYSKLKSILTHYCSFLPFPIYLENERINTQEPLWMKAPSACTKEEYLAFYRFLYPMEEDPLFWVHLNVDYPFHMQGILYFPKIRRDFDFNRNTVKLYCNRVFVADNCKDVIPNYLMVLRGVIDSPDIPLNVSRSYLQMDRTVRQLAGHISKKVCDSLATLYRSDRDRFNQVWDDASLVIKLGVLEDEKLYERAKEFLVWKTTDGQACTTEEYLERNREKTKDCIYYTTDQRHAAQFLSIYTQKGIEVIVANNPIDPYLMQFLERKLTPATFQRIDGGVSDAVLDKDKEKTILDPQGKTEATYLADFVRQKLGQDHVEVEAQSLASDSLPGVIIMDESQRRMREYFSRLDPSESAAQMAHLDKRKFVINTNSPLINDLQKLDGIDSDLTADLVRQTYDLALLSQREMDPNALHDFVERSNRVIEKLTHLLATQAKT